MEEKILEIIKNARKEKLISDIAEIIIVENIKCLFSEKENEI